MSNWESKPTRLLITQAKALELFRYDPDTGELRWRTYRGPRAVEGAVAGSLKTQKRGHQCINIQVNKRIYKAHRIIWLMQMGKWPNQIDHINHDGTDNRWQNLRAANQLLNNKNCRLYSNNISGRVGVCWSKKSNKWHAQIGVQGKVYNLGYFVSFYNADKARKMAERKHGFHPNHGAPR